jgi:hypothetical protein
MKKQAVLLAALSAVFNIAIAQTITVTGTVKADQGSSLPLALVQDKSDNIAARTDSTGGFSLSVKPDSKLVVSCAGYQDKVINVNGKTDLLVILKTDAGGATVASAQTPSSAFNTIAAGNGYSNSLIYGNSSNGGLYPSFSYSEETKGSRYLFNDWVTGFVVSPTDSVFKNPNYAFNYDKINGDVLLTHDKHEAIEIDKDKIKSFTLNNANGESVVYVYMPAIDKTHYPQLVAGGKKYNIYKLTKTRFVKNNYHSDGMTSTGNNYDEYVDDNTYYVLNNATKQLQPLSLKKKSIKAVFAEEGKKLDTFFDAYDGDIDDGYLKNLGDFVNK